MRSLTSDSGGGRRQHGNRDDLVEILALPSRSDLETGMFKVGDKAETTTGLSGTLTDYDVIFGRFFLRCPDGFGLWVHPENFKLPLGNKCPVNETNETDVPVRERSNV